jgi:S-formylglutathione hydrolase FrmB
MDNIENRTNDVPIFIESRAYAEGCFGDLNEALNSDKNPKWLVNKLVEDKVDIPKIYMACGKDDFLLEPNKDFKDYLEGLGVSVDFEVGPGAHEWDFWNLYIKKVLEWLPLENSNGSIDSGNIGV